MRRVCDFLLNNIEHLIEITDYEKLLEECIKRKMVTPSDEGEIVVS